MLEALSEDCQLLPPLALPVAIQIASRTDKDGITRAASQLAIATRLGANERSVRRVMSRIISRGWLEIIRRGDGRGLASEYRPLMKGGPCGPPLETERRTVRPSFQNSKRRTIRVVKADNTCRKGGPHGPTPLQDPIKTPSATPSSSFGNDAVVAPSEQAEAPKKRVGEEETPIAPSHDRASEQARRQRHVEEVIKTVGFNLTDGIPARKIRSNGRN